MNTQLKKTILIIIATLVGYISMGLLITAVQEWTFKGVSYYKSSTIVLGVAGFGTFLSAVAGGWIAFRINSYKTRISNYIMCLLVVCETTWLITTKKPDNPIWFDVLAASSLIVGIILACHLKFHSKKKKVLPV